MGLQIEDGTGTGRQAKVDDENRLVTAATNTPKITSVSANHGESYVWTAYVDWGADKNAVWLRNDSNSLKLHIDRIHISPAAAAVVEVWVGNGNTAAGTTVTGVNLNRSSGKTADATGRHTNTNVDAGAGMTLLGTYHIPATTVSHIEFYGALVLGVNREVAVNIVTDVGATAINVLGYFNEDE